jgi:hypothetical protein
MQRRRHLEIKAAGVLHTPRGDTPNKEDGRTMKLEIERLEERIAPWFAGGIVLQGASSVGVGAGVGSNGAGTNGTHGTQHTH